MLPYLLVSFTVLVIIILLCYARLLWSILDEKRKVREDRRQLKEIYCGLYREYEKTRGPEWAKNQLSEVIRNIVKGGMEPATDVYRA